MTVAFSIVVPAYNRADVLPRAIESALAQTDGDLEVVVVDDGSTDDTAAVVQRFDDARVRYQHQPNAGVSAARNAGAGTARGRMLVFLDSDDELLPGALARVRAAASTNEWDVVLSGWIRVSPDLREVRTFLPEPVGRQAQLVGPYLPGAFAIAKATFVATGGYDEHLRFSENTVLGWRIREVLVASGGRIGMIDEPLVVRYSQPDRAFDQARYEAAVRILEHYGDALDARITGDADPATRRSTFLAAAGANAAALGKRAEAWRYSIAALRSDPTSPARYRGILGVARTFVRGTRPGDRTTTTVGPTLSARPESVAGDGWIVVTDDGDVAAGAPDAGDALREFGAWLIARGAPVGAVGFGGRHFDRRRARLRSLSHEERAGPATVDELGCGGSYLIRAAAAREVGGFDADLCEGLVALEYGLRLASHGYALYCIGPPWSRPPADPRAPHATDRRSRYYEARNLVVITRRYVSRRRALAVTARNVFVQPALVGPGIRGSFDAWTGRLGCRGDQNE